MAVDDANEHVISVWDLSRDRPHKITETKVRGLFAWGGGVLGLWVDVCNVDCKALRALLKQGDI